jgi:hypothetical protein
VKLRIGLRISRAIGRLVLVLILELAFHAKA